MTMTVDDWDSTDAARLPPDSIKKDVSTISTYKDWTKILIDDNSEVSIVIGISIFISW